MSRLVETVFPDRLGTRFRWLVTGSWVSNIGDGLMLAAGPLLVASQTHDPMLVAAAAIAQQLPWLVFGLVAGALADRLDRRTLVVSMNASRGLVILGLCTVIWTGHVNIAMVLAALLLHATAEVFADTTASTLTPMLVDRADLGIATSRTMVGFLTANQLVGPALGAFLFAAGMAVPFMVQAVCIGVALVLVSRIGSTRDAVRDNLDTHLRQDVAEGMRWLLDNRPVRTLAIVIVLFNITWAAPWGVLVLWAQERAGVDAVGFGLLTTAAAVGGLIGTFSYGWVEKRVPLATLMRVLLLSELVFHLGMALTTSFGMALAMMVFFGAYAFQWGTLSTAVRQRAVPTELQGRVGSVYMLCVMGGMLLGTFIGGLIARQWGLTAPWWFAFGGGALALAVLWRELGNIAHADAEPGLGVGTSETTRGA